MSIQVIGTIVNAVGLEVPNSIIRVTPTINGSKIVHAEAVINTDDTASYSFQLADGEYLVEVLFPRGKNNDEYTEVGKVTLVDSSGIVSLNELLINYAS